MLQILGSLPTDSPGQLNIPGHDGDPLGVDGADVGVLEQSDKVSLTSLLQGPDGRRLESQVGLEILGNLSDETLEGKLKGEN